LPHVPVADDMRALIAGVGYPDLSDHSISWAVVDRLERTTLPAGVVVEDASYNPVAVAQRLEATTADERFEAIVFVSAVERGRPAGTVTAYRWDLALPPGAEIHRAVTDAVTGIIHLDNTLVVTRHLGALPERVAVVEIEPLVEAFATEMSPAVASRLDDVCTTVVGLASGLTAHDQLPYAPLGGPKVAVSHG
jgi:hydrogenase maturation protease